MTSTPDQFNTASIKAAARAMVAAHVKAGKLVRPKVCSQCLQSDKPIQGHHEDYSKPLDVIWLCVTCHFARHSKSQGPLTRVIFVPVSREMHARVVKVAKLRGQTISAFGKRSMNILIGLSQYSRRKRLKQENYSGIKAMNWQPHEEQPDRIYKIKVKR